MSSAPPPNPSVAPASARAPFKKRPRHFWDKPDPADESEEEKQEAEHVSPVARLYRHALESVFAFLKLGDLSVVLAVCRSWSSAVRSMASIGAAVMNPSDCCWRVAASPLAHHVTQIGDPRLDLIGREQPGLIGCDMFILSRHLPWLTSLSCRPELPLLVGPFIQLFTLDLTERLLNVGDFNNAIVAVSRLPRLVDFRLQLEDLAPGLNFEPLASAAQLRDLVIVVIRSFPFTTQQLGQLRALSHLRKMALPWQDSTVLVELLRTPHSLQWQEIHEIGTLDADVASVLSTLPTLTTLKSMRVAMRIVSAFPASTPFSRSVR